MAIYHYVFFNFLGNKIWNLSIVMKDGPIKGVEYKKGNIIALNTHDKSFE